MSDCARCGRQLASELEEWDDFPDLICFGETDPFCAMPEKVMSFVIVHIGTEAKQSCMGAEGPSFFSTRVRAEDYLSRASGPTWKDRFRIEPSTEQVNVFSDSDRIFALTKERDALIRKLGAAGYFADLSELEIRQHVLQCNTKREHTENVAEIARKAVVSLKDPNAFPDRFPSLEVMVAISNLIVAVNACVYCGSQPCGQRKCCHDCTHK